MVIGDAKNHHIDMMLFGETVEDKLFAATQVSKEVKEIETETKEKEKKETQKEKTEIDAEAQIKVQKLEDNMKKLLLQCRKNTTNVVLQMFLHLQLISIVQVQKMILKNN